MSTKTAVYVRVSTLDQEKGIESQEHALREYLQGHGIKDALWFRDRISGKDTQRPAFQKLQEAIFNGQVRTVIVWKLDRLSRSLRDGINVLTDWIDKKVRVVSITQQIDLDGPMGRMIAAFCSHWPKWSGRISARTRSGEWRKPVHGVRHSENEPDSMQKILCDCESRGLAWPTSRLT